MKTFVQTIFSTTLYKLKQVDFFYCTQLSHKNHELNIA